MNQIEKESIVAAARHDEFVRNLNPPKKQFGISALFWLTFMVGLAIAYLQQQGSPELVVGGIFSVVVGLAVGLGIGLMAGKTADTVFWATLIAAFGYIATAGDQAASSDYRMIWASIGAVTGAVGATVFTKQIALNAIACGVAAGLVMLILSPMTQRNAADVDFDLYASPIIGVAVACFMRMVVWLESKRKMPRYVTATWLLVAVIIGSWFS